MPHGAGRKAEKAENKLKLYYIDRKTKIKHFTDLCILQGCTPQTELHLDVPAQEDFVLQLAVLPETETEIQKISFSGALAVICVNTQITNKFGQSSEKGIALRANTLQPLFFVLPADEAKTGRTQAADIEIQTDKGKTVFVLQVYFTDELVENHGYNELWRLSRLSWLNSTRFLNEQPTEPYFTPVVNGSTIRVLGRDIEIGENGLPRQVSVYFDESIRLTSQAQKQLFASPMEFCINGALVKYDGLQLTQTQGCVHILAQGKAEYFETAVSAIVHYEGFLAYSVAVTALQDFQTDTIALKTQISPDCADYINGLGAVGGAAHDLRFQWSNQKHHDCLFIGAVNAGLRVKWKAENYRKPLINIYYKNMPLIVAESTWDNHKKGSISLKKEENAAFLCAETGTFKMQKGETRRFDFELHFTPLKPIDYQKHYAVRYSHNNRLKNEYKEVNRAAKLGLNNLVIHHGNMVHPFINYPFIETERLKALVDYAKNQGLGVKVYYTTREHSNHMEEVFAYKALGDEIILRKKGEGYSWHNGTAKWLTEYFGEDIIPAWKVEYRHGKYKNDPDVSFIVRPNSRLDNYYIEGLDWLVKNIGIKGIYIDDTALDRTTLARARRVLMQNNGLIDMHMWNHEEDRAGDVSCMNLYTELFPFLDSLWIGEGYPYKRLSPAYLLTEVSGIPYGQTSQMLEGGGNPYIGMLYAMNNRYGWGTTTAPRIYALWDSFGIENSEMRGYWHSKNPIFTGNDSVKATVYIKEDSALVCMFNFSEHKTVIYPKIDNTLLGFKAKNTKRVYVKKLQKEKTLELDHGISLRGKDGIFFLLSK